MDQFDKISKLTTKIYNKYPDDNDIWQLLQSLIDLKQKVYETARKVDKIYKDLYE